LLWVGKMVKLTVVRRLLTIPLVSRWIMA